jgi:hypothetical protein
MLRCTQTWSIITSQIPYGLKARWKAAYRATITDLYTANAFAVRVVLLDLEMSTRSVDTQRVSRLHHFPIYHLALRPKPRLDDRVTL